MEFDLFTLLPLAAAIFVFWKLRSVLGTRNENDHTPYDQYSDVEPSANDNGLDGDNVVTLPSAKRQQSAEDQVKASISAIAGNDKDLKQGLTAIVSRDPSFNPDEFLPGAKMAYEMIVTGFADGDKRALKGLLSREVYENFEAVIDDRASRNEVVKASFVGIEKAEISAAELVKDEAHVSVRFVSQMISATVNSDDEVVEGDLNEVAEIVDVWTFARSVKSRDPNWKLVATDE